MIIISLNAIIKEVAHGAKIGCKLNSTVVVAACLGNRLPFVALIAHHLFHGMPVHFMRFGVVVAVTASIHFSATRGHQTASSHIVFATTHALA
jgi:hypothetical protein